MKFWVNVYKVRRVLGGPEGGGWYYLAGEPLIYDVCDSENEAVQTREICVKKFSEFNAGDIFKDPNAIEIRVEIETCQGRSFPVVTPTYK